MIAGLGVILAVLPGQDSASPTARPAAADLRLGRHESLGTPSLPAPGLPAAGPFYPPHGATPEPQERSSEKAPSSDPERERSASFAGAGNALPPGHDAGAAWSPGHPTRGTDPHRPPVASTRHDASALGGEPGRSGTSKAHHARQARNAPPGGSKPTVRGSATATGNTTAESTAAKNTAARNTAATDTAARSSAAQNRTAQDMATGNRATQDRAARNSAATRSPARDAGTPGTGTGRAGGSAHGWPRDPCLRFDDLRRDYCYQVLRSLTE